MMVHAAILIFLGLFLGANLGRVLDRSGFTVADAVPEGKKREAMYAAAIALALIWVLLGLAFLAGRGAGLRVPAVGLPAALIGGLASGLALGWLGTCPLQMALDLGQLRPSAIAAFAGWIAGIILFFHSPGAALAELGEPAGVMTGVGGFPLWLVLLVLGTVVFLAIQRAMVNVYPHLMEWPKAGAGLAVMAVFGWWLAVRNGEPEGMNAMLAVRGLAYWTRGNASLNSVVFWAGLGILAFGAGGLLFGGHRRIKEGLSLDSHGGAVVAGLVLGAGNAVAGGDPAYHLFCGAGVLNPGSMVFVVSMAAGIFVNRQLTVAFAGKARGKDASMNDSEIGKRIWARDVSLWHSDRGHHKEIAIRLGWLNVAESMRAKAGELAGFAREAKNESFQHAFLLGMGGSSLAPEVFNRVFGAQTGGIGLTVLDTTDPAAIAAAEAKVDLKRILFIVSSKSGGTIEVNSLFRYFHDRTGGKGSQFIAITDPETTLGKLADEFKFRRLFINPPDIGGRYSVLSYFGLVPAALLGVDTGRILDSALQMMKACGPDADPARNPGLSLGLAMGRAALGGRDKVTLILDPKLTAFGLWIEQLLAESTGKEGKGLVPVAGEPLSGPEKYGNDRFFVSTALGGNHPGELTALERAGHPVIRIDMNGLDALGGEYFRWEFATAAAGAVLGIDPFDQPNVKEAKDRTAALLEKLKKDGRLPDKVPSEAEAKAGAAELLAGLKPGRDYLGILAFVPFDPATDRMMTNLRCKLREKHGIATTFGYGPRYLHSTGQLHKGGGDNAAFILITCDQVKDLPIPGQPYTFAQLERAQALGDLESLEGKRRRTVRIHADPAAASQLIESLL
jgi:glucose-6-phosphate isomerase